MSRMRSWGDFLSRGGDPTSFPVTGLAAPLLRSIQQPAIVRGPSPPATCAAAPRRCGRRRRGQVCYITDPAADDGMHTLAACQGLHACLPAAAQLVVSEDKDTWVARAPVRARRRGDSSPGRDERRACAPPPPPSAGRH